MNDILNLFSVEPELIKINEHIPQNEGLFGVIKKRRRVSKFEN